LARSATDFVCATADEINQTKWTLVRNMSCAVLTKSPFIPLVKKEELLTPSF
jgi:hypothetical protein